MVYNILVSISCSVTDFFYCLIACHFLKNRSTSFHFLCLVIPELVKA
uniref:Uncharacterized protein n=1 Tax=Anguilla anguilla TaxID=7936 RepID=A0A0E9S7C2_ANGAN